MADLPDYYTQAQISEAQAASLKGGLDANKSATPVSKDIYLATDTVKIYYCVVDGAWTDVTHACLLLAGGTMTGAIAMGTKKITGLGAGTANADAIQKQQAILQALLTTQGDLIIRGESVAERLAKITTGQFLKATATGYEGAAIAQATKEFFVPVSALVPTGTPDPTGNIPNVILDSNGDYVFLTFRVPHDFTSLTSCVINFFSQGTGTIDWTVGTVFYADSEIRTTHTDSDTADGMALVNLTSYALSIADALTNLAAGDNVSVKFTIDALEVVPSIVGLTFKYS